MKQFVLLLLCVLAIGVSRAQTIYQTAASGNYNSPATWVGGALGDPPTVNATCDCKIVINPNHVLTMNINITLTNTVIIIKGNGRMAMLGNNRAVLFPGPSSAIDIKDPTGSIVLTDGNPNSRILVNGQQVWSQSFRFQSATNGTVQGIASVTSATAPTWSNVALPVKLSGFFVSKDAKGVSLAWKTSSEVNSSHFEIERSADGKNFNSIGEVNAAGNTGVEQNYSFSDGAPADGENYYRLKIVDIDATFEYSPIKSVSYAVAALNVVVGPNPATSFINVKVSMPGNEPYRLRLINRSGQVVYDQKYNATANRVQLSVANYADGSYFLEVSNNSGLKQVNKVMIVRK